MDLQVVQHHDKPDAKTSLAKAGVTKASVTVVFNNEALLPSVEMHSVAKP